MAQPLTAITNRTIQKAKASAHQLTKQAFSPANRITGDRVRFGKPALGKNSYNLMDRLKLAGRNIFMTTDGLKSDFLCTIGGTALFALIPPHVQALGMLPLCFVLMRAARAFPALVNPAKVAKDLSDSAVKKGSS